MLNPTNDHNEVGNSIAALLASSKCPADLRQTLEGYVAGLFQKARLTRPEIVRAVLPFVLLDAEAAAAEAAAAPAAVTEESAPEAVAEDTAPAVEAVAEAAPASEAASTEESASEGAAAS